MYFNVPPATQALILANVLVFVLEAVTGSALATPFALWPFGPQFAPWQVVTYAFLHGSVPHLFFNMFALYMFGSNLERVWGARRYATYYGVSVVSAALAQLAFAAFANAYYPTIGASGGVFGLLLAFALYFPRRTVVLMFLPMPMPAWLFAMLYGAAELVFGVTGTAAGIAHFAHLGGMLGGYLLIRYWRSGGRPHWGAHGR
jgi:membrane associated rhomboid family serine protease